MPNHSGFTQGIVKDNHIDVTISDASATEGSSVAFNVSLSANAPAGGIVVNYTTSVESGDNATTSPTAPGGADFVAETKDVTIPEGSDTATINVTTSNDAIDEHDETFTLTLNSATGAILGSPSVAIGTIVDNDDPVEVMIQATASVDEGQTVSVIVSLSSVSGKAISNRYDTAGGTASWRTDYVPAPFSVSLEIPAGNTSGTIQVNTLQDAIDEENETFYVALRNCVNCVIALDGNASEVTILDDDDPPSVNVTSASADEGARIRFRVTLLPVASGKDVSVQYTASSETDNSATAGTDYTVPPAGSSLTFSPGQTSRTFSVSSIEDSIEEDDETFTVTLSNPTNASLGTATATGTIVDDDELTVTVEDSSAIEGSSVDFDVNLSRNAPIGGVTVTYSTSIESGDTATLTSTDPGGIDFTSVTDETITITEGTSSATISVSTTNDATDEDNETFTLTITDATNAVLGSPSAATGTIQDNDTEPDVSISSTSGIEGGSLQFTVNSTEVSGKTITVPYATINGTASAPSDFTEPSSNVSVSIGPGDTTVALSIQTVDDSIAEVDETFTVMLANPTNAGLATSTATGTILDNDPPAQVTGVTVAPGDQKLTVRWAAAIRAAGYKVQWKDANQIFDASRQATTDGSTLTYEIASLTNEQNYSVRVAATLTGFDDGDWSTEVTGTPTAGISDDALLSDLVLEDLDGNKVALVPNFSSGVKNYTASVAHAVAEITVDPKTSHSSAGTKIFDGSNTELTDANSHESGFQVELRVGSNSIQVRVIAENETTMDTYAVTVTRAPRPNVPASGKPTLHGSPHVGWELTSNVSGITDNDGIPSPANYMFQWFRVAGGTETEIAGATTYSYRLAEADQGNKVKLRVSFVDSRNHDETVFSNAWPSGSKIIRPKPSMSISCGGAAEGSRVPFTITLSEALEGVLERVHYGSAPGDSDTAELSDYESIFAFLEIDAGLTSITHSIGAKNDNVDEPDETFTVLLTQAEPEFSFANRRATCTIHDTDSPPEVEIQSRNTMGAEEPNDVVLRLNLSKESEFEISVDMTTSDGMATAGDDYVAWTGETISWSGQRTKDVTITILDDNIFEGDHSFDVEISNPVHATLGSNSRRTVTITDDESAPLVSIVDPTDAVIEGEDLEFPITLTHPTIADVIVDYTLSSDSATADTDYVNPSLGDRKTTIDALATTGTINVETLDDGDLAADETVTVTLSSVTSNATIDTSANAASGTIKDDDPSPKVTGVTTTPGDSTLTIAWSVATAADGYKIQWKDPDQSYHADRQATTDATTRIYEITGLTNDTEYTVRVAATRTSIADGEWSDDARGTPSALVTTNNAATSSPTISGTARVGKPLTADTSSIADTDGLSNVSYNYQWIRVDGSDRNINGATTSTYTLVDADAGKKVKVQVSFSDDLGNPESLTSAEFPTSGTIRAKPTVKVTTPSPSTTEGSAITVGVELSENAPETLTVNFRSSIETGDTATLDSTAPGGADFTEVSNGAITINAGSNTGSISVDTSGDSTDEPNETFTISLITNSDLGLGTPSTATATITDDDDPPSANVAASSAEEGNPIEFSVSLFPSASGKSVSVPYSVSSESDDTATEGTDYTSPPSGSSVSFPPGTTSQSFSVSTVEDVLNEDDETFTVTLGPPMNATLGTSTALGTINDDDSDPTLSVADVMAVEGANLDFNVAINAVSARTVAVDYSITGGTAVSGTDYIALANGTATIIVGTTSTQFTIATTDDALDEVDEETIEITLSNAVNATLGNATVTGWIEDNDLPPTIGLSSAEASEGSTLSFTATLSTVSGRDLSVSYSTAAGTATSDVDYAAAINENLTIVAGSSSKAFDIASVQDDTDEADEIFTVTLDNPTNVNLGTSSTTGTIVNDDPDPVVTLELSQSSISELSESSSVTATLDRPSGEPTTVTIAAQPVAPAVLTDFSVIGTDLTIPAGQVTSNNAVQLNSVDNPYDGPDLKTITVSGTSVNPLGFVDPGDVTLSITDDEVPATSATLSLTGVTGNEVNENSRADIVVNATLDGPAKTESISLTIKIEGRTALPADFQFEDSVQSSFLETPLTIPPLQTTGRITVPINFLSDNTDEKDETIQFSGSGDSLTIDPIILTILDVDPTPTVELTLNPTSIPDNGSSSTVTASLDHLSSADTLVTVLVSPVGQAPASAILLSQNTELTIAAGSTQSTGTVTITAADDVVANETRSYEVSATASNDIGISLPEAETLTVTDTEQASTAVVLTAAPTRIAENAPIADRTITVSATLDGDGRAEATELTLSVSGGTAIAGTDFVAVDDFVLTIPEAQSSGEATFELEPIDDAIDEGDETFRITGPVSVDGLTIQPTDGLTLTIVDDDEAPTVSLTLTPSTISEDGGSSTVTAALDTPASAAISIEVNTSPGADTTSGDYTLSSNTTLTIAAGNTSSTGTVTVQAVDDGIDEPDHSVIVSGQASSNVAVVQPESQLLTITDDDDPPTQAALDVSVTEVSEGSGTTTVTVTANLLGTTSSTATILTISVDPGSASNSDFTAVPDFTLTIAAAQSSGNANFQMIPVNDDTDEPPETVTISGTGLLTVDSATLTIVDDDATPIPTLTLTPNSIGENGGVSAIGATLNRPSSSDTTITISAAAVAPATNSDFTLASNSVVFIPASETTSSNEVSITAVDNAVSGPEKEITISGVASNSLGIANVGDQTLTITDDEAQSTGLTLTLSGTNDASVNEDAGSINFTVTAALNGSALSNSVVVNISVTGGTASNSDFNLVDDFTVNIPAGEISGSDSFEFIPIDDDLNEIDETVLIVGSTESDLTVSPTAGLTLTIVDDDEPLAATLVLSSHSIDENGGTTDISAALSRAIVSNVSVAVQVAPVAPATNTDYKTSGGSTLTIPAGATASNGAITVTAVDNDEHFPGKRLTVTGTATAANRTITQPSLLTITIDEDEVPVIPVASIVAVNSSISEGNTAAFTVSVTPTSAATLAISLDVRESGDTIEGTAATSVTVPAGSRSVSLNIATENDDVFEDNSVITVRLGSGSGYEVGTQAEAMVTVTDDDTMPKQLPATSIVASNSPVTEGTDAEFTISLSDVQIDDLTINVEVGETGDVLSGMLPSTVTVGEGSTTATLNLSTVNDNEDESDSQVTVMLVKGIGYELGDPLSATVFVNDDDPPPNVVATGAPTISGTAQVGETLTASVSTISDDDGLTEVTFEYQWIRTATDGSDTEIPSATSSSYIVTSSDVDNTLKVRVDFTDDLGNSESATSVATNPVEPAPNQAPVVNDDTAVTNAGAAVFVAVLDNDSDPDGDTLSITAVTNGNHGITTIVGTEISYQPNEGFDGIDQFSYTVSDGTLTASATVTVTIAAVTNEHAMEHAVLGFGQNAALNTVTSISTRMNPVGATSSAASTSQIRKGGWRAPFDSVDARKPPQSEFEFGNLIRNTDSTISDSEEFAWLNEVHDIDALTSPSPQPDALKRDLDHRIRDSLLRNGSFLVSNLLANGEQRGIWTLWGQTAITRSSNVLDDFQYETDVISGTLGVDYEFDRLLIGLAGSYSAGTSEYLTRDDPESYEYETTLLSYYPYIKLSLSNVFSIWGVYGQGEGEIRQLARQSLSAIETDIESTTIGLGFNGRLIRTSGGGELSVKGDTLTTNVFSNRMAGFEATSADAVRHRLFLEASKSVTVQSGGAISTGIEMGVRYDDGSAEIGQGAEVGGFIRYRSPTGRVLWHASSRSLVAHEEEEYKEWGAQFTLAVRSRETVLGPSLNLRSNWGISTGQIHTMWSQRDPVEYVRRNGLIGPHAIDLEIGYGLRRTKSRSIFIPYVGTSRFGRNGDDFRIGLRMNASSLFNLQLEGSHRSIEDKSSWQSLDLKYLMTW